MEISKSIIITQELVTQFANISGDYNPLHVNKEFASNSVFGRPIAHGMLLSSFFSSLIAEEYPGPGSIYLSQSLNFLKPCFIDDKIKVVVKLIKQENTKYYLSTLVYNINNEVIIQGEALILKKI